MLPRNIRSRIDAALADTPAVLIHGARQTGKTTLVEAIADERGGRYLTLDAAATHAAATSDPEGFLAGLGDGLVVLDEVQRAPALLVALKRMIDKDRRPGRYLLTGSANVMTLPKVAESLAGRMETIQLWPFAQNEIAERPATLIERLFAADAELPPKPTLDGRDPWERVFAGGFPEAVSRERPERRVRWFESYVASILDRDVRDIASVRDRSELDRLLRLGAARTASLLNYAKLGTDLQIPSSTLKRYFHLLEAVFLIRLVPAWTPANLSKRTIKAPKMHMTDTGLVAALLGIDRDRLNRDPTLKGALLETFVVTELIKHAASTDAVRVFHFRTASRSECDVILENRDGRVVAIEVKAAHAVGMKDAKTLAALRDELGERFVRGVVVNLGDEAVPLGERLSVWPLGTLVA